MTRPISILLGVVSCEPAKVDGSLSRYKIAKKTHHLGSGSLKIIEFVSSGKDICEFLLVVNSNLGRASHGFGATATYWSKIASEKYDRPI